MADEMYTIAQQSCAAIAQGTLSQAGQLLLQWGEMSGRSLSEMLHHPLSEYLGHSRQSGLSGNSRGELLLVQSLLDLHGFVGLDAGKGELWYLSPECCIELYNRGPELRTGSPELCNGSP